MQHDNILSVQDPEYRVHYDPGAAGSLVLRSCVAKQGRKREGGFSLQSREQCARSGDVDQHLAVIQRGTRGLKIFLGINSMSDDLENFLTRGKLWRQLELTSITRSPSGLLKPD